MLQTADIKTNSISLENFASINSQTPAETVSRKYSFVPTTEIINALQLRNWNPVKATQVKTRKAEHEGFQKHMIRFRNPDIEPITGKDNIFPEIVLVNSHNGLSSFNLMAGLFRLICTNGLIVADSLLDTMKIKHIGYTRDTIFNAIEYLTDRIPDVSKAINTYQEIELTPDEKGIFATSALHLKYEEEVIDKHTFDINRLLQPKRENDKPPTLWNTYNTIQEKFIKGDNFKVNEKTSRYIKARGIKSIDETVKLNKALWSLTQRMAELKTGG